MLDIAIWTKERVTDVCIHVCACMCLKLSIWLVRNIKRPAKESGQLSHNCCGGFMWLDDSYI